ncbi:MAG: DUF262 domain-containing protein [Ignavibacteriae bacterium]|nr:DUF262 domain-containing protein [Ignavibacteriota bacterium]MCB9244581.1 DUF262 domain-containing protein [Ignavibacteriales bacterium]
MSYDDDQIIDVIDELNRTIFLPDIQREFIWKPEQVEKLFDSLMLGYPIGSFLFWKIREEHIKDWTVYEFFKKFDAESPHNSEANLNEIRKDINLVLDGQQRLTSLFIGLKGTYRYFYYQWKETKLYLNLFKKPEKSEDPDILTYQFKFVEPSEAKSTSDEYWYQVSNILKYDKPTTAINEVLMDISDYSQEKKDNAHNLINDLYNIVFSQRLVNYYEVKDQDYDKVVEIFVRTNTGGKKLEYSDILLSKATAKWENLNAREELNNFTDAINKIGNGYSFDKDFVLKGCLYLTEDLPIKYKVANFTKDNLVKIEKNWENIKNYIEESIRLVYRFGFNDKNLTSSGVLLPISLYLKKEGFKNYSNSSNKNHFKDQKNIATWLILVLLKNIFGSSSDTVLSNTKSVIEESDLGSFPYTELNSRLKVEPTLSDLEINELLETTYKTKYSFSILSLLYRDREWKDVKYHEDHIYPKSEFTKAKLSRRGYTEAKIKEYQAHCNTILNLQLLTDSENLEKNDKDFNDWIKTRNTYFKNIHSIPELSDYSFDNFLEFISLRRKIIYDKLSSIEFD